MEEHLHKTPPDKTKKIGDFAHLDVDRATRRGYAEAIYCESKTVEQVVAIAHGVRDAGHTTLFTRATKEQAEAIIDTLDDVFYDADAGFLAYPATPPEASGVSVLVVAAGTSDLPQAKEALHTASYLGRSTSLIVDVGVAGIHRLLSYEEELRAAGVIIVAAGMDGALPGVVAGLVSAPVVALPTSVGYGAGAGGIAPLLTMLNACAPGVGVVNIDNGYGAGHLAAQIAAR
ncbi:nickel pincer cofactor biosynthesis protein LarB [Corynebacterium glutamicum]|uniref:nickel pincer cofactor biosynthesis protein LarB n=1 Tax=Corynebacterium glutamicum TaxID=1718 RepID=UPI001B8D99DE|nr:nickel pincer cofactor biosynthesis protein LarB [Corynebacterium glutamicum]